MYKKLNGWLAEGDFSGFSKKLTEIRALLRPKNAPQLSARLFSPNLFILCDLYRIFPERDFGAKKSVWRGRKGILGVLRAWWRMRKGILGHENRHSRSGEMGNLHFLSGSEKLGSFAGCHRKPADDFFGVAQMQDERLVKFFGDRIWSIISSCSFLLGGDLFFSEASRWSSYRRRRRSSFPTSSAEATPAFCSRFSGMSGDSSTW